MATLKSDRQFSGGQGVSWNISGAAPKHSGGKNVVSVIE